MTTAPWEERAPAQLLANQRALADCRRCEARLERQIRRLRRLDHAWNPLRVIARPQIATLLRSMAQVQEATVRLEAADRLLRELRP